MAYSIKYTKSQYAAKITELEGQYSQLESHLSSLEGYKEQMYQFWDDENARKTGEALASMIRQVKNSMDRTKDMITFYKSTVEKLDGANIEVASSISDAIGILAKMGY